MARILLIDDDDAVREIMGEILTRSGHTVIEARNGDEGLDLFADAGADLVITDMVMPGKGGREVMRDLRLLRPHVKIIAMSGGGRWGMEDVLAVARLEGAAEVIAKPFAFKVLMTMIDGVLGAGSAGAAGRL